MLLLVIEKMKNIKIAIALVAVVGLVAVTVGLAFAHYFGGPYYLSTVSLQEGFDEDWWTEMREHMEARWSGLEDEEWFDEMTQYMEEHYNEVQSEPWFEEMLEYMEDRGYYGHAGYGVNFFGSGGFGRRGFGCWGW